MNRLGQLIRDGLFLLTILLTLSGCTLLCNLFNGEGYCGRNPDKPDQTAAAPNSPQSPASAPDVQTYFWNETGFKCVNSMGQAVASHRGMIQITSTTTFIAHGNLCSTDKPYEGKIEALEQFGNLIGFEEGIYEKKGATK